MGTMFSLCGRPCVGASVRPCVRVCLFVRELLPQFSFFLHQIWHTKLLCIDLESDGLGFLKKYLFLKLFPKWPLAKKKSSDFGAIFFIQYPSDLKSAISKKIFQNDRRHCRYACFLRLFVLELLPQFSVFFHQTWHTELLCIYLECDKL